MAKLPPTAVRMHFFLYASDTCLAVLAHPAGGGAPGVGGGQQQQQGGQAVQRVQHGDGHCSHARLGALSTQIMLYCYVNYCAVHHSLNIVMQVRLIALLQGRPVERHVLLAAGGVHHGHGQPGAGPQPSHHIHPQKKHKQNAPCRGCRQT